MYLSNLPSGIVFTLADVGVHIQGVACDTGAGIGAGVVHTVSLYVCYPTYVRAAIALVCNGTNDIKSVPTCAIDNSLRRNIFISTDPATKKSHDSSCSHT